MTNPIKLGSIVMATVRDGKKTRTVEAFLVSHVRSWLHGEFYVVQERYSGDEKPRESAPSHQCSVDEIEAV